MLEAVLTFLSVGAAGVPMIGFLIVMVLLDRYEREPFWLVSLAFLWGAIGAVIIAVVGSLVFMLPLAFVASEQTAELATTIFVAPLVEEPAKALGVALIALSRHVDGATDGFVYGAAAGLGFGMTENGMYFIAAATEGDAALWAGTVFVRTVFTAMMHACATSIVGAALGAARYRGWGTRLLWVPAALVAAMAVHALWNGPLALDGGTGFGSAFAFLLFPAEFGVLFGIYQLCLLGEARIIKRELTAEAADGLLPRVHVGSIASWRARLRTSSWLPEGVDPKEYLEAATLLAFRRRQLELKPGDARIQADIETLRGRIRIALDVC